MSDLSDAMTYMRAKSFMFGKFIWKIVLWVLRMLEKSFYEEGR